MTGSNAMARQQAIEWTVRAHDPVFDDWEGLADWLAVDPLHAVLYDQIANVADETARVLASAPNAAPPSPSPAKIQALRTGRERAWPPFALAASLVAAVGGGWAFHASRQPELYAVTTQPGARQTLKLDRTVTLEMNGDSRLTLDRHNTRFVRLDGGEVMFTVTRDPSNPFRVIAGDATITDIGTVFDVERDKTITAIAVAEGQVRVTAPGGTINVEQGQHVSIDSQFPSLVRGSQPAETVGAWRTGRIDFTDVPIEQLALRLHRAMGANIQVAGSVGRQRVSGSIVLGSDVDETFRSLAALLGISIERKGSAWIWGMHPAAHFD
jgi:transmembrane sensor